MLPILMVTPITRIITPRVFIKYTIHFAGLISLRNTRLFCFVNPVTVWFNLYQRPEMAPLLGRQRGVLPSVIRLSLAVGKRNRKMTKRHEDIRFIIVQIDIKITSIKLKCRPTSQNVFFSFFLNILSSIPKNILETLRDSGGI